MKKREWWKERVVSDVCVGEARVGDSRGRGDSIKTCVRRSKPHLAF